MNKFTKAVLEEMKRHGVAGQKLGVDFVDINMINIFKENKVMAGVTTVKPENAQRVFDAVEHLGYRVDPLASDMRRAKRRIIGAIMPEFESEFFGQMVTQLESLAEQRGYTLVAASSRGIRSAREGNPRTHA